MKHYVETITQTLESITCDRCNVTHTDTFELQEFLSWTNHCGYGSTYYEDGYVITIDLCQKCVYETLGTWMKVR